jgi:hypothetical protein
MTHSSNAKQLTLTDRDCAILEHVARYRTTLYAVLRRLFFAGMKANAAVKVISRLIRLGYLQKARILSGRLAIVLSTKATQLLGTPRSRAALPGAQSLPIDLAVLLFAATPSGNRQRLMTHELRATYPWMTRSFLAVPHCHDLAKPEAPILELIRVDLGGKPDHIARKCDSDIRRRLRIPQFHALLDERGFRLVIVTPTVEKARSIREALDRHSWPDGLFINFAILPLMLNCFGGIHRAS